MPGLWVDTITSKEAARVVIANHYLHRRPSISHAIGLMDDDKNVVGVVTFGTPPSRHLQISACPSDPSRVAELNRLWLDDSLPQGSASWFMARALRMLPPLIVVSYADTAWGHLGYVYRACNFRYAGWTDMDRKTPRYDYIPASGGHTRDAFRGGYVDRVRRRPKVKYWITTGSPAQRRRLTAQCAWPTLDWREVPPPIS